MKFSANSINPSEKDKNERLYQAFAAFDNVLDGNVMSLILSDNTKFDGTVYGS